MPIDDPPAQQRALVLQGGGALGAYEAGVFKALHRNFFKPTDRSQFFDIVAGVSIGAANASVLVANVLNHGNKWHDSADALYRFWDDISTPNSSSPLATRSLMWWLDSDFFKKVLGLRSDCKAGLEHLLGLCFPVNAAVSCKNKYR